MESNSRGLSLCTIILNTSLIFLVHICCSKSFGNHENILSAHKTDKRLEITKVITNIGDLRRPGLTLRAHFMSQCLDSVVQKRLLPKRDASVRLRTILAMTNAHSIIQTRYRGQFWYKKFGNILVCCTMNCKDA